MKKMAYKGFDVNGNGQLNCKGYIFEVGKIYTHNGPIRICESGFHFCWELNNVHNYYNIIDKVICEVEILGDILNEDSMEKSVTNKIKIIRLLTKEEIFKISNAGIHNTGVINSGNSNSGNSNSGDWNSGNWNSGNCNSGNSNSGDRNSGNSNSGNWNSGYSNSGYSNSGYRNSGNWNSGDRNSGDCNSGNWNSGDWNSGDCNSGYWNTGDWNSGDCNSGDCNTKKNKCFIFDNPSEMTNTEFRNTKYFNALCSIQLILTEWIHYTEEEKNNDKAKKLIGGYLKTYNYKDACKTWWGKMTKENKEIIQEMPNFDKDKFFEITGIKLED